MTLPPQDCAALRAGLAGLPDLAHHRPGESVSPDKVFFPPRHANALNPDAALVVGNRGVGKSFWASALSVSGDATRHAIVRTYGRFRNVAKLDSMTVRFGFSGAEGGGDALVTKALLAGLPRDIPATLVWRGVIVRCLAPILGRAIPAKFADLIAWVQNNPDEQQDLFRQADKILGAAGKGVLILFDQLEQLADEWGPINELTKGLLQTALAMQSYKNIRLKIFMRKDQYENRGIFSFPDASKIKGDAAFLLWSSLDLYGLLFLELMRNAESADTFRRLLSAHRRLLSAHGLPPNGKSQELPPDLLSSAERQEPVFEAIAGPFMGKTKTKGATYSWIPLHLSDSRGEVSPRTWFKALKIAAGSAQAPVNSAIDHNDIKDGVRAASEHRLTELQEDYPWVSEALEPLRGLHVPAVSEEVYSRWKDRNAVKEIMERYKGNQAPLDLSFAYISSRDEEETLLKTLQDIGVMDVRKNGKVDVPDIFRIRAGILRRGGVPPQQRRRL